MRNWGSALFPLSILLVLSALTFWLRYATEFPSEKHDGKSRHDPDYLVEDAVLRKLDPTGRLQYTLRSDEIRHYPDDDSTELKTPHLVAQNIKKPNVTMSAERGHLSQNGEKVDLYENVQVVRAATSKDPELKASTSELTILPDDEKAFTKQAVQITQGKSWIKGVGLQIDNRTQTYILESRATASLASKSAKTPTTPTP